LVLPVARIVGYNSPGGSSAGAGVGAGETQGKSGGRGQAGHEEPIMFERFTERARKVIILAREEAIRLGHNFVGSEHLLLGLIREGDGLAVAILKKLNVSVSALKAEIEKIVAVGRSFAGRGDSFTRRPRRSWSTPSPWRDRWVITTSARSTCSWA
jgi:hypothetical protein